MKLALPDPGAVLCEQPPIIAMHWWHQLNIFDPIYSILALFCNHKMSSCWWSAICILLSLVQIPIHDGLWNPLSPVEWVPVKLEILVQRSPQLRRLLRCHPGLRRWPADRRTQVGALLLERVLQRPPAKAHPPSTTGLYEGSHLPHPGCHGQLHLPWGGLQI